MNFQNNRLLCVASLWTIIYIVENELQRDRTFEWDSVGMQRDMRYVSIDHYSDLEINRDTS